MGETSIAWTDYSFNPWWGCQRVSPGCENCYAESFAKRVGHGKRLPMIWGPASTTERKFFGDAHWNEPRKWNARAQREGVRRRVFCASMADVFEDRDDLRAERLRLFILILETPHLDWLLLTKRPENIAKLAMYEATSRCWIGTTVEDQKRADERIPVLCDARIPAAVKFVSAEPLLGPIADIAAPRRAGKSVSWLDRLDWVIVGGESGPGARPFDLAWARSIRKQCKAANVPCFVKQMGAVAIDHELSPRPIPFADRKGGDWTEWPEELRVREWPTVAT